MKGGRGRQESFTAAPPHVDYLPLRTLTDIEHLQALVGFTLLRNPNCKTLEIFLPAHITEFFHTFRGIK
jgi:hypothetical protein